MTEQGSYDDLTRAFSEAARTAEEVEDLGREFYAANAPEFLSALRVARGAFDMALRTISEMIQSWEESNT